MLRATAKKGAGAKGALSRAERDELEALRAPLQTHLEAVAARMRASAGGGGDERATSAPKKQRGRRGGKAR